LRCLGTQEGPGGTQEARDILQTECVFSYAPAHKSDGGDHFRVDGSDVTITVYRACAQDVAAVWAKIAEHTMPNTEDTPPEPPQRRLSWELENHAIVIYAVSTYQWLCLCMWRGGGKNLKSMPEQAESWVQFRKRSPATSHFLEDAPDHFLSYLSANHTYTYCCDQSVTLQYI